MTHDPIMHAGVSPYEGLGSNPISLTDPWGLEITNGGGAATAPAQPAQSANTTPSGPAPTTNPTTPEVAAVAPTSIPSSLGFLPKNYFEAGLPYPTQQMMEMQTVAVQSVTPTGKFTTEDLMKYPDHTIFYLGNDRAFVSHKRDQWDDSPYSGKLGLVVYDPVKEQWNAFMPVYRDAASQRAAETAARIKATENLDKIAAAVLLAPLALIGGIEAASLAWEVGTGLFSANAGNSLGRGATETTMNEAGPTAPVLTNAGAGLNQAADKVGEPVVTLYRGVMQKELEGLLGPNGRFSLPLGRGESKYFSTSIEHVAQYARMAVTSFKDSPYTIVSTQVPLRMLQNPLNQAMVDRGIPAYLIPANALPELIPNILNYSLYPWGLP